MNREVLLVIIFSVAANVGLVRLYAVPAASSLRTLIEELDARGEEVAHPERAFVLTTGAPLFGAAAQKRP